MLLYDAAGKELARNEDSHGGDWPGVHRAVRGRLRHPTARPAVSRRRCRYRLVIGALPYLDRLFPFGGKRGSTVDLRLEGQNLEGADRMSLRIAADAATGRQEVRTRTAGLLRIPSSLR